MSVYNLFSFTDSIYWLKLVMLPYALLCNALCYDLYSDLIHYITENGLRHASGPVHTKHPIPYIYTSKEGAFVGTLVKVIGLFLD